MRLLTAAIGTFRTCRDSLTMSAHRGKADIPPQGRDFRLWTSSRRSVFPMRQYGIVIRITVKLKRWRILATMD